MKLTIERAALLRSLAHVQNVVERRTTIPILSNVKLAAESDRLGLTATDMDLSLVAHEPAAVARRGTTTSTVLVRTGHGKAAARRITVKAGPGDYRGTVVVTNGSGRKVACAVARRISYTEETVRLSGPRRCLGNPRWVQVATRVLSTPDRVASLYSDTAGSGASLDFQGPLYSRRVYR